MWGRLVGYEVVDVTTLPGEFEGAEFGQQVELENGMVFEFEDYGYSYSYAATTKPTAASACRKKR